MGDCQLEFQGEGEKMVFDGKCSRCYYRVRTKQALWERVENPQWLYKQKKNVYCSRNRVIDVLSRDAQPSLHPKLARQIDLRSWVTLRTLWQKGQTGHGGVSPSPLKSAIFTKT